MYICWGDCRTAQHMCVLYFGLYCRVCYFPQSVLLICAFINACRLIFFCNIIFYFTSSISISTIFFHLFFCSSHNTIFWIEFLAMIVCKWGRHCGTERNSYTLLLLDAGGHWLIVLLRFSCCLHTYMYTCVSYFMCCSQEFFVCCKDFP